MRVIYMGTPAAVHPRHWKGFARDARRLKSSPQSPRPTARGDADAVPEPPPVKEAALRLGIPVLQPDSLRSQSAQNRSWQSWIPT